MSTTNYNRIIRKMIIGFGNLFNNITLVRFNKDETEQERFLVPIAYASKEDYVMRLQFEPDLNKKVQMTLPRLSFELTGLSYDVSRKQNTNTKNFAQTATGLKSQYNPVPYDFDFNLYLYVRNIEDGTQILEHILPFFTPDYTIKLNLVPEMGIVKEVPVVLNSADIPVDFEGTRDRDTRTIVWTLNFTVKGFIFGAATDTGSIIKHTITNVLNNSDMTGVLFDLDPYTGPPSGDFQEGEIVYQGYSLSSATATGKVKVWNTAYNYLTLNNLSGNFTPDLPLIGTVNHAKWYYYAAYPTSNNKFFRVDVTPNPPTANVGDSYTYNTTVTNYN